MDRRRWLFATTVTASGLLVCAAASAATPVPRLTTATVVGDRVTLNFSGAIRPRAGGWTIVANGVPVKATSVAYGPKRVQLVLPNAIFGDDTLRVVGRNLRSKGGARLKLVDAKPVIRSPAGCTRELGAVAKGVAGEGPTDTETFLAPGRFRVLTVQVDYADAPASALDGQVALTALDDWIRDLSYGRASVSGTSRQGVVRMAKNYGDYARSGPWGAQKAFFQDMVIRLDPEIDFAQYDTILVTTAVKGGIRTTADVITIAPTGTGVVADGRELRHFGVTRSPRGALRLLLQLAGLPELTGGYVGSWDPMSTSSQAGFVAMLAWHRRKLGWLDPSQVRCLGSTPLEIVLQPTWRPGGVKAIVVQTSKTTAIVLENRQRAGLDAPHCRKGILAYEVRTDWQYHLWIVPAAPPTFDLNCENLFTAPYDFRPKDSIRIQGAVTFELLSIEDDGSYRLRVTR